MKDHQLHSELKKEFQLERMILFSDAVFAIAITLLAIELKIPEIPHSEVTEEKLGKYLLEMLPKFIGFLISFFLIGLYWTVHHRLFGYVVNYTMRLLWLNLLFLLFIVLMPFTTAFYSSYISTFLKSPFIMYCTNICLLGIMNIALWRYATNPKHALTEGLSKEVSGYFILRARMVPSIFALLIVVYFISPRIAVVVPLFVPLIMWAVKKLYRVKEPKHAP